MKFLNVKCEERGTIVYINIERIVVITRARMTGGETEISLIEVDGLNDDKGAIRVNQSAEEVIRMINGESKTRIGFRAE